MLDVGSGSGYLSAVFHHLVTSEGITGKVVGIDHIPELVELSIQNLKRDGLGKALEEKQIEMIIGDGRQGRSQIFLLWLPQYAKKKCLGYASGGQ